MTSKKNENEEVEETEVEETEVEETGDDEEKGWGRLEETIGKVVEEKLSSWSGPQVKKMISSGSRQKPEKKSTRKKGFLSGQFFSGLTDEE
jgi:hypothetical protein